MRLIHAFLKQLSEVSRAQTRLLEDAHRIFDTPSPDYAALEVPACWRRAVGAPASSSVRVPREVRSGRTR